MNRPTSWRRCSRWSILRETGRLGRQSHGACQRDHSSNRGVLLASGSRLQPSWPTVSEQERPIDTGPDRRRSRPACCRNLSTAEAAREAEHPDYVRLIRSLRPTVAQQPLTHLQTVPHVRDRDIRDDFLFDASGFHKKMTVGAVDRIGTITLRPGIPEGLRRTSALLRGFIRTAWTHDVVAFNRAELDAEDLDGFLFGTDRTALRSLVEPLRDLQDDLCFYCGGRMAGDVHIDHVVAWSMIPIDGVANLVAADSRCNLDKSASIPVRAHVDRALERPHLTEIARITRLPRCIDGPHPRPTACSHPCPSAHFSARGTRLRAAHGLSHSRRNNCSHRGGGCGGALDRPPASATALKTNRRSRPGCKVPPVLSIR